MVSRDQEEKMIDEIKYLVELFLNTSMSDVQLAEKTGLSSSTIGRRLTDKAKIIKAYPKNGMEIYEKVMARRKENLQKAKIIGGQTSMLNNTYLLNSDGKFTGSVAKLRLDVIFDNEIEQWEFLCNIALTFKINLKTISRLFQIDEKKALENLISHNRKAYTSLIYLFYRDKTDQEIASTKFISYYKELLAAVKNKDNELLKSLINQVGDSNIEINLKDRVPFAELTELQLVTLIEHQLKYSLSSTQIAKEFDIDVTYYHSKVYEYLSDKPTLKDNYDNLLDYYDKVYKTTGKRW